MAASTLVALALAAGVVDGVWEESFVPHQTVMDPSSSLHSLSRTSLPPAERSSDQILVASNDAD
eukprot:1237511-Amorphochlora_amoeboformis.AAC.1